MSDTIIDKIWRKRGWAGKAITFSVVLHLSLLASSGFIIILHARFSPPAKFNMPPPPERPALEPHKLEMRAKMQDLQKASSRPRLAPRMVAQRPSEIALPDIKKMANTVATKVQRDHSSMGVSGFGFGIGGGYGSGIGGGLGGGLPIILSGRCDPVQRLKRLQENGGESACETAVVKGLQWLAANQAGDGAWGQGKHQCAMTGLALLAFLGHCETPDNGPYGAKLRKAVDYLVSVGQRNGGRLSEHGGSPIVYEHAIATYALCETYTMTKDAKLEPIVRQAVEIIVKGQTYQGGWVYGYGDGDGGIDISATGWNFQALKAAHVTGLNMPGVQGALASAIGAIKKMQNKSGHWEYQADKRGTSHPHLTGVGVTCLAIWNEKHSQEARSGGQAINDYYVANYRDTKTSLYGWYYSTLGCFQIGGSAWSKWRRTFQKALLGAQNGDGSWPDAADANYINNAIGNDMPIYRTALCTLMLEVYYRYLPSS